MDKARPALKDFMRRAYLSRLALAPDGRRIVFASSVGKIMSFPAPAGRITASEGRRR